MQALKSRAHLTGTVNIGVGYDCKFTHIVSGCKQRHKDTEKNLFGFLRASVSLCQRCVCRDTPSHPITIYKSTTCPLGTRYASPPSVRNWTMRNMEEQMKKLVTVTGVMLMAAAEAMAQEKGRPARRIVVSIPDRKLAVMESDKVVRIFPVAVGAPKSPSPTGSFEIVNHIVDPTWYTKGKIVGPGPSNPLGTRWMGLSAKGYGIHGTNVPTSIGKNASHGCIRLKNTDVEKLFELVAVGDQVELLAERTDETARLFDSAPAPLTVIA
jgi:lipoprotein-anchoring transpeptidase ErfK/SrfK